MESIFGISTSYIASGFAVLWLLVAVWIVWTAARHPILAQLAVRQIPRRKAQTALVTLGLMLSTTIMTVSLATGDTMSHAIRTLVASSLGRADEVVILSETSGWRERRRALEGLQQGDVLAAATSSEFPYSEFERIREHLKDETAIAAVLPAIAQLRPIVNERSKLTAPGVKLLAVPSEYPSVFGSLQDPSGAVVLADLDPGEVYLNAQAAAEVSAVAGDYLDILEADSYGEPRRWRVRVKQIVQAPGLAGAQASVLTSLEHVWNHDPDWTAPDYINVMLVANVGDAESSVEKSSAATRALRVAVADSQTAGRLHGIMSEPEFRNELEKYVRDFEIQAGLFDKEELGLLQSLLTELGRAAPSAEFVSLMGDPELVTELGRFARQAWLLDGVYEAGDLLGQLHPLSVREIKRIGVSQADLAGSVVTSIFLVLGLFSIAVGVLLIFLLWVMLAAERRPEMGTARALGFQRQDLMRTFLFEGALYSLLSSVAGVLAGVLVGRIAVALLGGIASEYGITIEPYYAPRSLLLAFCLGGLLTLVVVAACSWRISHLTIVAAIRDLPDTRHRRKGWGFSVLGYQGAPIWLLLLGLASCICLLAGERWRQVGVRGLGETLLLVSVVMTIGWLIRRAGSQSANRVAWTVTGLLLIAYWSRPLVDIARAQGLPVRAHVDVFVLGGVLIVLGAVWVAIHNLSVLLSGAELLLRRAPSWAAVVRAAVAYPRSARSRTGLVLAMFSLVIFTMVVGSVLTQTTGAAYTDVEKITGGFELSAASSAPIPHLDKALASASAVQASAFSAAGGVAELEVDTIRLSSSTSAWRPSHLTLVDTGWLQGTRHQLLQRAPGYDTDEEVWRALVERPGLAVAVPESATDAAPAGLQDPAWEDAVWVRDPRGGQSLRLSVIGLLDPRSSVQEGVLTSAESAAGKLPPFDWDEYFFKLAQGEDARRVAMGLEFSFAEQGLRVDLSGEQALQREAVRILLNYLLTGFMGLGLIVGIAALGVIAIRAVVERRKQMATMRAIGFKSSAVQLALLVETSVIAALGILLGIAAGLRVSRNIVTFLALDYPELIYVVPWRQLVLLSFVTWVCVLLATAVPAWQASRIPPAAGLRTE